MSWLLGLKAKAWALGALVIAGLGMLLRLRQLEYQRDKARARAKVAEAERDQERDHAVIAKQVRRQRREKRKEAVEQVMAGEVPDVLGSGINDWN